MTSINGRPCFKVWRWKLSLWTEVNTAVKDKTTCWGILHVSYNLKFEFLKIFPKATFIVLDWTRYFSTSAALSSGVASSNQILCFMSSCCCLNLWPRRDARRYTASAGLSRRWAVTSECTSSSFSLKHPGSAEPILTQVLLLCCTIRNAVWNEHIPFCSLPKAWQLLSFCRRL